MQIETLSTLATPVRTTNATDASFTTLVPTTTRPTGEGVIPVGAQAQPGDATQGMSASGLVLIPFGVGSDNNTFDMRVFGWRRTLGAARPATSALWVPVPLAVVLSLSLESSLPGVANSDVAATNYFCSAGVLAYGNQGTGADLVAPLAGTNLVTSLTIDAKGFQLVEVRFSTGSSAASCNALWAKL